MNPITNRGRTQVFRKVDSSCSTSDTRVTKQVIGHEIRKDREVLPSNGTYQRAYVTHIYHTG